VDSVEKQISARNGMSDRNSTEDMPMTRTVTDSFSNDAAIDEVIATCNGDMRGAIKALLLVNEHLETELQHYTQGSNMARRANVA
jgi:hypothetical protein